MRLSNSFTNLETTNFFRETNVFSSFLSTVNVAMLELVCNNIQIRRFVVSKKLGKLIIGFGKNNSPCGSCGLVFEHGLLWRNILLVNLTEYDKTRDQKS